jgi:hypothetical protein
MATAVSIVDGFSPLNRAIMYISAILAPAQAISGIGHTGLSNLGFLAYNYYAQIVWFRAVKHNELHALALVVVHTNTTLAFAYVGGIFSGNRWIALLLAFGAMGVLWLNNATAWISWMQGQEEGYGEWQFFFFGWRTLTHGWHKFIMVWQIANTLESLGFSGLFLSLALQAGTTKFMWWHRLPAIPLGGVIMAFILFPYILFVELLVRRNHIDSGTDWGAVYAFGAQVALMLLPDFGKCVRRVSKDDDGEEEKKYFSLGRALGWTTSSNGAV